MSYTDEDFTELWCNEGYLQSQEQARTLKQVIGVFS